MFDKVITLQRAVNTTDSYGDTVSTITGIDVFCDVKSVGMKEKYEALQAGLNPEFTFTIADYLDYNDEQSLVFEGKTYRIIRTYRNSNRLEIVVTRDGSA